VPGYSPKIPLEYNESDGHWGLTKSPLEVVRQNLRMLVLTSPGERIMDSNFGVGIRNFIFEQYPESEITGRIHEQVSRYMPFVEVTNIGFQRDEHYIYIRLSIFIKPLSKKDVLDIKQGILNEI